MAGWLESLENFGSGILGATQEGIAERIKSELNPDAPRNPVDRPETQYDTQITEPVDGPESHRPVGGAGAAMRDTWNQYKWWIAGGLGVVAYMAIKGRLSKYPSQ